MKTLSIQNLGEQYLSIFSDIVEKRKSFKIEHENKQAIMLSAEEYESMLETIKLLSTPGFKENLLKAEEEIGKGEHFSIDDVF